MPELQLLPHSTFPADPQWQALHELVDLVAERQRLDFGQISSTQKPDGSLVTACDQWSDATLEAGLAKIFPGDGLLSEEGSTVVPHELNYWVVDPLDGTTNFSVGLPIWAISMARFSAGVPVAAILDVPPLRQRFVAVKGKGVWRDGPLVARVALAMAAVARACAPVRSRF